MRIRCGTTPVKLTGRCVCLRHRHSALACVSALFVRGLCFQLQLKSTPINTKGFESLLSLVNNTCKDSFDLFRSAESSIAHECLKPPVGLASYSTRRYAYGPKPIRSTPKIAE